MLTVADVRRAWDDRDPDLPKLIARLADQPDPPRDAPLRDGAKTFDDFVRLRADHRFRSRPKPEQAHQRVELLKLLEAPDAEVPLPDRLKVYAVVLDLWRADDPFARSCLLEVIATVPLRYGPWRAIKKIFKESEAAGDTEVYGAVAARIDAAFASPYSRHEVSGATLGYLSRRAWRFLRRTAVQLPATYADVAVDLLCRYPADTQFQGTWVANHIFYHGTKKYGRGRWQFGYRDKPSPGQLAHRAYPDLWKRSPRPLFTLLERAKADDPREFAAAALKADFRAALRDVEPVWVVRLVGVQSRAIDDFVVWLLQNVPTFDQAGFRTNGLHPAVLRLVDSPSDAARKYAADYARTHARDLPVAELVRLADNSHEDVRKLAQDLLGERDPRTDVGLAAWGELLETPHGHAFAAKVIPEAFGPTDLTPDWFADRILAHSPRAFDFASKLVYKVHPPAKLGPAFGLGLLARLDPEGHPRAGQVLKFVTDHLDKFDPNAVDPDGLRRLAVFPGGWPAVARWVDNGKLKPQVLGVDFVKALGYHPDWEAHPWVAGLKSSAGWAADLAFDDNRASQVLAWLGDVRKFGPADVGFDWLMGLVARPEPSYHEFAVDLLIRAFAPADFVEPQIVTADGERGASAPRVEAAAADLKKASFLFTGKLATMTRADAEGKVKAANGTVAKSVTKTLHYLVVGDDGSPLYGHGKKGDKQTKAEQLNADGAANIAVISETAFLAMLAGRPREADADKTRAGCDRLWRLAVAPGPADAPVAKFARQYVRRHHPVLGAKLGDKPVDPGTEVPAAFLTFDRVSPLYADSRRAVREFALDLSKYEFARWEPSADQLVGMCELPFPDVRRFVAKALLDPDTPDSRTYRLDPDRLAPAAAYRFCEAADDDTRAVGMELIRRVPRLRVPDELFRLTESPDRRVRAFVIRALWQVYRDRGLTPAWKPPLPPKPTVGVKAKKAADELEANRGDGVPARPAAWPAAQPTLAQFLRRVLFEVPPGPPEKSKTDAPDEPEQPTAAGSPTASKSPAAGKPLPARRAKLDAVETMRDLALEDPAFAAGILPLLDEFLGSTGKSERAACLVAVTRIRHKYPAPAAG